MNVLAQLSWTLPIACVLSRTSAPPESSGGAILRSHRTRPGPSWRKLYILLSFTTGLFALTEAVSRGGAWRHFSEFLAVVAIFGGMALWIRANRMALAEADGCSCAEREIETRVVHGPMLTRTIAPSGEPQRTAAGYEVVLAREREATTPACLYQAPERALYWPRNERTSP